MTTGAGSRRSGDSDSDGTSATSIQFGAIEWTTEVTLVLDLVAVGERFSFHLATPEKSVDQIDLASIEAELYSQIQDFIAESRFGLGTVARPEMITL